MPDLRVITLLPGATEIVAALGGEHLLVAVSHECDWPPSVRGLPRITSTAIDTGADSRSIDAAVRELAASGRPVIAVDAETITALRPDLLITQNLCEVCAVADGQVMQLARALRPAPEVLSLSARDLPGVFDDMATVASALDLEDEATELTLGMRWRLGRLRATAPDPPPRVLCIEWLQPVFLAGHWVPDLVSAAGGLNVGIASGGHSTVWTREEILALTPDLVVVMLCGFDLERSRAELARFPLPFRGVPIWLLDGNAFTSRPGPRLVDGAVRLQSAMHGRELSGLVRVA